MPLRACTGRVDSTPGHSNSCYDAAVTAGGLPPPIAEGSLATRPFAHVLLYVHQQQLSGTLVVWPEQTANAPRGQDRILIGKGRPVAGRLLDAATTLERGMLPLFIRRNAPYAFYAANLVGAGEGVLTGDVDPVTLITASLRGAAREDAVDAVVARFGDQKLRLTPRVALERYGFDPKELGFIELIRAAPDTADVLCSTWGDEQRARRLIYLLAITKSIEAWTGEKKRTTGGVAVRQLEQQRSGHTPAAGIPREAVARAAKRPQDEFAEVPPERPSVSPRPSSPPRKEQKKKRLLAPEPPPPPPPGLSLEHEGLWYEIAERAAKIESMNYFDMLGVGKDASPGVVRDAYFALAKKWHPDRLPAELSPLRPWVDTIFFYATQARDTLSDEDRAAEYFRAVQSGGGTPEADRKLNAIVTAAMAVQKVEVLVRRREWLEAMSLLREAVELNPDEADAHAMLGWVIFQTGLAANAVDWEAVHEALDRALALNERSARAHLFKATVLKRQGKDQLALSHYREVLEVEPKNIEAAREVRLAEMRNPGRRSSKRPPSGHPSNRPSNRPSKRPSKPPDSLLGKLFGQKKK